MHGSRVAPLVLLGLLWVSALPVAGQGADPPGVEFWGIPTEVRPGNEFEIGMEINNTGPGAIGDLEIEVFFDGDFEDDHAEQQIALGQSLVVDLTVTVPRIIFDGAATLIVRVSGERGNESFGMLFSGGIEVRSPLNTLTLCFACFAILLSPIVFVIGYRKMRLKQKIRSLAVTPAEEGSENTGDQSEAWLVIEKKRMAKGGCPRCGKKIKMDTGLYCRYKGALRAIRCLMGPFCSEKCHDQHYEQHPPEGLMIER